MNKKAGLLDSIYMPAYILGIAITIFIAIYVWQQFAVNFGPIAALAPGNVTLNQSIAGITPAFQMFDYMFPLIVGGLLVTSLILSFKTGANVAFAYVSIILWVFAILMSSIFTYTFQTFAESFPALAIANPVISWTMDNLRFVALGWGFLITIVMFTRNKQEQDMLRAQESYYGAI